MSKKDKMNQGSDSTQKKTDKINSSKKDLNKSSKEKRARKKIDDSL